MKGKKIPDLESEMPLKKSSGQMYPWVTHTHSHLGGRCGHGCSYCYVQKMAERFPNMKARYSGPVCMVEKELEVEYGEGRTIFIEHMNDIWGPGVDVFDLIRLWDHIGAWPNNIYVFQSKNPCWNEAQIRDCDMVGTTIETNRHFDFIMGQAPYPLDRKQAMVELKNRRPEVKRFVTIEPIMDFDLAQLALMIDEIEPAFVNIGADSKSDDLPEPPWSKVVNLIEKLGTLKIEVRQKRNLERLRR
jgi:DNA repair photolyase